MSDFELSFAGVPFGVPDKRAARFVEEYMPLCDLRDVHPRHQHSRNTPALALHEPPEPPPLRLFEFFYPTGASRWCVFRGLVDGTRAAAMRAAAYAGNVAAAKPFVIHAPAFGESPLTTPLYLLPPRPVTASEDAAEVMYLITLVCERYYWQHRSAGVVRCTGDTASWTQLVSYVATQLGATISVDESVAGAYGSPEPASALYGSHEPPALLLDAVAANVGAVVVRKFDGTFRLQRHAAARTSTTASRANATTSAGGLYPDAARAALISSEVVVTFPQWVDGEGFYEPEGYRNPIPNTSGTATGSSYGAVYDLHVLPAHAGAPYTTYPTVAAPKVLRTTAKARYAATPPSGDPSNKASLDATAIKLAKDWWDAQLHAIDEVYPGVRPWTPDGGTDCLYRFSPLPMTRVWRRPFNLGPAEFQHGYGPLAMPGGLDFGVVGVSPRGATRVKTLDFGVLSSQRVEVEVDDSARDFSTSGTWTFVTGTTTGYLSTAAYSSSGDSAYAWWPIDVGPGSAFDVQAYWYALGVTKCASVRYEVWDAATYGGSGVTAIAAFVVDQTAESTSWHDLGRVVIPQTVSRVHVVVRRTAGATGAVVADGVRLKSYERVIDDEDAGFSTTGSWSDNSLGGGYATYVDLLSSGVSGTATWEFDDVPAAGTYDVFATWRTSGTMCRAASYSVLGTGDAVLAAFRVDQRGLPSDVFIFRPTNNYAYFDRVGTVTIPAGTTTVKVVLARESGTSGNLAADAVCLRQVVPLAPASDAWLASEPSDGAGRVQTYEAGIGRTGVVTHSLQFFEGAKAFVDGVTVSYANGITPEGYQFAVGVPSDTGAAMFVSGAEMRVNRDLNVYGSANAADVYGAAFVATFCGRMHGLFADALTLSVSAVVGTSEGDCHFSIRSSAYSPPPPGSPPPLPGYADKYYNRHYVVPWSYDAPVPVYAVMAGIGMAPYQSSLIKLGGTLTTGGMEFYGGLYIGGECAAATAISGATTGGGLAASGTDPSRTLGIATGGVTSAMIADGTIVAGDIADGAALKPGDTFSGGSF